MTQAHAGTRATALPFNIRGLHLPHPMRTKPFYDPASYRTGDSVGFLVRQVNLSVARYIDARAACFGLTDAQWAPLLLIQRGHRSAAALAQELRINAGAVTRLLDRMEVKKLIQRTRSEDDRRRVILQITPAGERALKQIPSVIAEANNAHLAGFTREEFRTLDALLRRMADNGRQLDAPESARGTAR